MPREIVLSELHLLCEEWDVARANRGVRSYPHYHVDSTGVEHDGRLVPEYRLRFAQYNASGMGWTTVTLFATTDRHNFVDNALAIMMLNGVRQ